MHQLPKTINILTAALRNLLEVAVANPDGVEIEKMAFGSAARIAADLLADVPEEPTYDRALQLAGILRALGRRAYAPADATATDLARFGRCKRDVTTALRHFDVLPLELHAHFETAIQREEDETAVIALTTNDEATYERTGNPGDLYAYVPSECPGGVEFAERMARLASYPIYGDGQQVGNALRASKALLEALLRGEHRSEGDLRDMLSNFDDLLLA